MHFAFSSRKRQAIVRIENLPAAKLCSDENPQNRSEQIAKESNVMSNKKSSNNLVVPSAREAMDKFKMEAANDLDVPITY